MRWQYSTVLLVDGWWFIFTIRSVIIRSNHCILAFSIHKGKQTADYMKIFLKWKHRSLVVAMREWLVSVEIFQIVHSLCLLSIHVEFSSINMEEVMPKNPLWFLEPYCEDTETPPQLHLLPDDSRLDWLAVNPASIVNVQQTCQKCVQLPAAWIVVCSSEIDNATGEP